MPLNPQDPDVQVAVFGKEVELFLSSSVGTYLVKRAENEIEEAIKKLRVCDPEDPKAVRQHQNEAAVAQAVIDWLADAINQGEHARQLLEAENA